ncbi:peptide deformylase [Brooklawnia sp.]|uniref:peptide deformylase n=1 Tax=Brooklawnia sp. TaxID=2699740 RepID=UPI00311F959D
MPTPREWAAKGTVLRITRWTEPVMRNPTRPVTEFGGELHQLVADMFATMAVADGVGLAAPQVDVDLALFVFHCPDKDDRLRFGIVCNPVVTLPEGKNRRLDSTEEGCLSWPGAYQPLARPDFAICEGQDENGTPVRIEGTGLLARCLQHETDHLAGTVFGDRLSKRSRRLLNEQHDTMTALYPQDWPISRKLAPADL